MASLKLILSTPRLELSAAYLLRKLAKYLKSSKISMNSTHLWSDSTHVLQWLKSDPSRWETFVANRSPNIHENMPQSFINGLY